MATTELGSPSLSVQLVFEGNCAEAMEWYKKAFDAVAVGGAYKQPGGDKIMHAALGLPKLDSSGTRCEFMLHDHFDKGQFADKRDHAPTVLGGCSVTVHLNFRTYEAVDAFYAKAVGEGCKETMVLKDQFWGSRYGELEDPFGYRWSVSSPAKEPPAASSEGACEGENGNPPAKKSKDQED